MKTGRRTVFTAPADVTVMERGHAAGAFLALALWLYGFVAVQWAGAGSTGPVAMRGLHASVLAALGVGLASGALGFDESSVWIYQALLFLAGFYVVALTVAWVFFVSG